MTLSLHELQAQLIELQSQLAFQEDAIQALDRVVAAQQLQIDKLVRIKSRLEEQMADIAVRVDEQHGHERPPHY